MFNITQNIIASYKTKLFKIITSWARVQYAIVRYYLVSPNLEKIFDVKVFKGECLVNNCVVVCVKWEPNRFNYTNNINCTVYWQYGRCLFDMDIMQIVEASYERATSMISLWVWIYWRSWVLCKKNSQSQQPDLITQDEPWCSLYYAIISTGRIKSTQLLLWITSSNRWAK